MEKTLKIHIFLLKRGDSVAAKLNLNTWKVGNITSISRDKSTCSILFNDGTKTRIETCRVRYFPGKGSARVYSTDEIKTALKPRS